ncbi:DUF1287 domain-containing protein [Bartonella sp. HY329]|uniref:DUF1287 domain-containing protein n=1 Tax=unclassified Bartonella TaxID=2645622 RepID=UPI0021C75F76|nr:MULTISPECIES: DUF1287 domain-containing protein [unclassified Bartonella]UXM95914.1 DUF1287 domain-containing protein [Bartonella sp. HY329]UXN10239.1 DUF1287 domain-containing protein [Bartonella sp. HY328]
MVLKRREFLNIGLKAGLGLSFGPLFLSVNSAVANPQQNEQRALALIDAARAQIGVTRFYNGAYQKISYPNGDIDRSIGVCTDVVIRAYRDAFQYDLQKHVHEDMAASFGQYPKIWGLTTTDRNIDHRRVPNLQTFFVRKNARIHPKLDVTNLQAGDIVTQTVNDKLPHIVIISNQKNADGIPLVIHNIGRGTQEEDRLLEFPQTGHYRFLC